MSPWNQETVDRLNAFQAAGVMHPFTCPCSHGSEEERTLVATVDGWRCPSCDYTQNWAHDFMMQWPLPGEPPREGAMVITDDRQIRGENRTPGDDALLAAAAGQGDGLVELTPEKLADLMSGLSERVAYEDQTFPEILDALSETQKIAVVAWAMRHICDHARDGGTFRYLIYERLGFSPAAYVPLCRAGGMDISNEFELPAKRPDEAARARATDFAVSWWRACKRPDLSEEDKVRGAIMRYREFLDAAAIGLSEPPQEAADG